MVSAHELGMRSHSYRNFEPQEFVDALDESDRSLVLEALERVESGRFEPMLEKASVFFAKLDRDEKDTFTRRNPGLVMWMSVWNRLNGYDPFSEWFDMAGGLLAMGEWDVPEYERNEKRRETLLKDLYTRRRSYREFTPGEMMEVADQEFEITQGQARELNLFTPETREEIDWPIEESGRLLVRTGIIPRIEDGRFQPLLRATHKFITRLDPDEKETFARRNPGIIMWVSAWAYSEHQIWGEQLFTLTDVEWPLIPERNPNENPPRPRDVADQVTQQQATQKQQVFNPDVTVSTFRERIREQMSTGKFGELAGEGDFVVERVSEPGDPKTRLETPVGRVTIPRYADDIDRSGATWQRTWDEGEYTITYSIDRSGQEAKHILRVDRQ